MIKRRRGGEGRREGGGVRRQQRRLRANSSRAKLQVTMKRGLVLVLLINISPHSTAGMDGMVPTTGSWETLHRFTGTCAGTCGLWNNLA